MIRRLLHRRLIATLLFATGMGASALAASFSQPINLTQGDQPASQKFQMSRNGQGTLQWGPDGRLHLVYWSGGNSTTLATPSRTWWRALTKGGTWSAPVELDDSTAPSGQHIGGRQPSMAFRQDGSLFVVWHDHRNSTSTQGWINNTEIYADVLPAGGNFSPTDLRLTDTHAGTAGDNGYLPRVTALPDGRLALLWYDYFWNAGGPSDLCLRLSDANGDFSGPAIMNDVRFTTAADRATADAGKDFTVASAAADSSGTLHIVWQAGNPAELTGTFGLYYGRYNTATGTWLEKGPLRAAAGHYMDPAKIVAGPHDTMYLIYSDFSAGTTRNILVQQRAPGATAWSAPLNVGSFTFTDEIEAAGFIASPDLAIETDGRLHVVYGSRKTDGTRAIVYRQLSASGQVLDEQEITTGLSGIWTRPALARDAVGDLFTVFEESTSIVAGNLWFSQALGVNAAGDWAAYE